MRFNWRRRFVATAFAAASMLPFAGCSSQQQQQATDEVAAEGQQSEDEEASAQNGGEDANAGGNEAVAAEGEEAPAVEGNGENVVTNNATAATEGGANGDLQEIISEMSGPSEGQAVVNSGSQGAPVAEDVAVEAPVVAEMPAATQEPAPSTASGAPVASAAPGMPELGSKMAYVVEPGDTLGKIAAKIYGDQKRWKDIAGLSGLDNPNHIYPGDLVFYSLEDSSKSFASNYEGIRRSKEIVRQGDTLAAIAKRIYGKSNLWKHIWRQNDNINNPDDLTAGMAVYYVNPDSIKTALIKIKNINNSAKASAKKLTKNLMTQASMMMPTLV